MFPFRSWTPRIKATRALWHLLLLRYVTLFCIRSYHITWAQLERTLTLIADCEIDIKLITEEREPTGTKRKRKAAKITAWKVEQLSRPLRPFSDTFWGHATREYMVVLRQVPSEAMATIVADAKVISAKQRMKSTTTVSEQSCSERAALTFR